MDVRIVFGANVRRLREKVDLSQDAFADLVGVHRTYMSGIERGKRAPSIIVVQRLAAALNVDPGELFAEQPEHA
jgi:transcriptional regulator with XRE-family HTH domain